MHLVKRLVWRRAGALALLVALLVPTLVGGGVASAQSFSDPVLRTVRVVATCDGPSGFQGAIEMHFHTFGSPRVGAPREISPPRMRCSAEEPTTEVEILMAVPMIWHAYMLAPEAGRNAGNPTCEAEGSDLPTTSQCPAPEGSVSLDIALVEEPTP
jgi:hypothetical protein